MGGVGCLGSSMRRWIIRLSSRGGSGWGLGVVMERMGWDGFIVRYFGICLALKYHG